MKKRIVIISISLAVLILAIFIISTIRTGDMAKEYRLFGDIGEFSCFDDYEVKELDEKENLIKGLTIIESYCKKIDYNGYSAWLYAHEFETEEDASTYMRRVRNIPRLFGHYYMINNGNKALFIKGSLYGDKEFMNYLYEHLTVRINRFGERIE